MAAGAPEPVGAAPAPDSGPDRRTRAALEDLGFGAEAVADLAAWRDLLETWSRKINLLGPGELAAFWPRHALDSAQLVPLAPPGARWIDLGAGAGFPGLAAAIAQKHAGDHAGAGGVLLVESVGKKAAFLRQAARALGLPAQVADRRWQDVPPEAFDVVAARAFAPLPRLFEAAHRFWGEATLGLFPKGKGWREEIEAARAAWRFEAEPVRSITGDGTILRVTALAPRRCDDGA